MEPKRPSARKSIHDHTVTSSLSNTGVMGRYGLNEKEYNGDNYDEVDNIQSCEFSKSLPTYLTSSRDDEDLGISNNINYKDLSSNSYATTNSSSFGSSHCDSTLISEDEESSNFKIKYYIIGATMIIILGALYVKYMGFERSHIGYSEIDLKRDFDELLDGYDSLNGGSSSVQLHTTIESISTREATGAVVLVYDSKSNHFRKDIFINLVNEIGIASAKYLRGNETGTSIVAVNSNDLHVLNENELVQKYKDDVDKSGVMLVTELENLPAHLALAFHYYCDEHDPLVRKSVIFFTLDLGECSAPHNIPATYGLIEKCLISKWSSIPRDEISPLLTRIVGVIVNLRK